MMSINVLYKDLDFRKEIMEYTTDDKNEICQCDDENAGKFHFYTIKWLRKWK